MSENPYAAPATAPGEPVSDSDPTGRLSSRWRRLGGSMIDGIAAGALIWSILYFGFNITFTDVATFSLPQQILLGLSGIPGFLLLHGYLLHQHGQTLGKRLLGMRIIALDGSRRSLGHLILRRYVPLWIVAVIPWVGNWIAMVDSLFIFRADKRCVHDLIAGTKVVNC
jgi:uncharacterized RDD family membrane protein YckC